jgi:hypothetical protein
MEKAMNDAFIRTCTSKGPADRVVFHLSRICAEDFNEILVLCGNGYGIAAQRLLRGMYERAVTARFISMNPELADDFVEFGWINLHKLIEPIRRIYGKDLLTAEATADARAVFAEFRAGGEPRRGLAWLRFLWRRALGRVRPRSTARWSGRLSFEAMARKTKGLDRMFVNAYLIPTFEVHASAQNIFSRVEITEDGMAFDGGPQREKSDEALQWATLILLEVFALQATYFNLPRLGDQLEQLHVDFRELWILQPPNGQQPSTG